MAKITFEDKVALNPQPSVAEKNKCTDANINEIKHSVNDLYDNIPGWVDKTSEITINDNSINTNRTKLYINETLRLVFLQVYYTSNISSTTLTKPIQFPITYKPAFASTDQLWFVMGTSNGGSNNCRATIKYDNTNGTYIDILMLNGTIGSPYGNIMYVY